MMMKDTERDWFWLNVFEEWVKEDPPLTSDLPPSELSMYEDVQSELGNIDETSWTIIDDDIFFQKDKAHKDGDQIVIGRCVGTVQTRAERLLGW